MDLTVPLSSLLLRREDWRAMLAHVRREAPLEACGLVGGHAGRTQGVYPVPNQLASPHRFRMEPTAQWQAMQAILAQGHDILAIYHSHPLGLGTPSAVDKREMRYPEALTLIWAPIGATWVCRGFRWSTWHQDFVEVPLRLE